MLTLPYSRLISSIRYIFRLSKQLLGYKSPVLPPSLMTLFHLKDNLKRKWLSKKNSTTDNRWWEQTLFTSGYSVTFQLSRQDQTICFAFVHHADYYMHCSLLSLSHFSFHFPDVHHAHQDCPPPTCLQFPSIFTFLSLRLSPDFLYRFNCNQQIFDNLSKSQEIFWITILRWEILVSMLFKLSFTWPDETLVLVSYYLILLTIWVISLKISWSLSFHKSLLFETNPTLTMSVW